MKLAYLAAIAALTISSPAFCQSTTVTTTGAASSTSVIVAPEQRTKIRTYITEHKVRSVVVKEKVAVPHYSIIGNHDIWSGKTPKAKG